jgi:hypothetical protein
MLLGSVEVLLYSRVAVMLSAPVHKIDRRV